MTHPSERTGWREALKVIASAWSVAFIILFWAVILDPVDRPAAARADLIVIFFFGMVIGIGWLIYRSREKSKP